jgi:hypothetical protein
VFATAEVAGHAQRLRVRVNHDHRVDAILVAAPAMVLNGLAGAILSELGHRM